MERMGKQKPLPHFQPKQSGLDYPSFTASPLRNLTKRSTRKIWILCFVVVSACLLIWYPPDFTLLTWSSEYHSDMDQSGLIVHIKDESRVWRNQLKPTSNSGNPYRPKTHFDFHEVTESNQRTQFPPNSAPSHEKNVEHVDIPSEEAKDLETPNVFEKLVVKQAPIEQYEPLPNLRLDPRKKFEDVKGKNHLTKELETTKFLTFLPHSGFHNQRIEIKNAFKVAKLLNRTLILPPLRLGNPVRWQPSEELSKTLANDEFKYERFGACLDTISKNKLDDTNLQEECDYYSSWTSTSVGYILNTEELSKKVPIIDRPDLRESWLWNSLKLSVGEWLEIKDDSRYSYQIYESSTTQQALRSSSKYNWRLNIDDLIPYNEARLLSFGSLFGSNRVVISSQEMENWNATIEKNQALNLPLLEKISDEAAKRLGGRGNYIGLHLRVGNAFFKKQAEQVIRAKFIEICKNMLKLDQRKVDGLIDEHERAMKRKVGPASKSQSNLEPSSKERNEQKEWDHTGKNGSPLKGRRVEDETIGWNNLIPEKNRLQLESKKKRASRQGTKLKCRGKLYKEQKRNKQYLKKLNHVIYLSTDVGFGSIANYSDFSLFTTYFPCLFSFDDLGIWNPIHSETFGTTMANREMAERWASSIPKTMDQSVGIIGKRSYDEEDTKQAEFNAMESNLDGLNLGKFLIPILESMIVSKGSHVIGTPGSTFSNYLIKFLHPTYLSEGKHA